VSRFCAIFFFAVMCAPFGPVCGKTFITERATARLPGGTPREVVFQLPQSTPRSLQLSGKIVTNSNDELVATANIWEKGEIFKINQQGHLLWKKGLGATNPQTIEIKDDYLYVGGMNEEYMEEEQEEDDENEGCGCQ